MSMYNRYHPFFSRIKKRYSLTQPGSRKHTQHVVLDLKGSGITYEVGDCIAVFPLNPPPYVEKMLEGMQAIGQERVASRYTQHPEALETLLVKHINLSSIPRKLVALASSHYPELETLLQPECRQSLKDFLAEREVWDFLLEYPIPDISIPHIVEILQPMLPRFYSIASHQGTVGDEAHLTVAHLHYWLGGYERWGICTHYLCTLAPEDESSVPIYTQAHKGFTLPDDPSADIVMIGPGTGIAPYVGFMQKRIWRGDTGRNWLFFGEWNSETDFFYEEYWNSLQNQGKLKVSTAFSRDQDYKIYVQHRILEQADELFQWIQQGAYLFVCGNAAHMAKDVEEALIQIIADKGGLGHAGASDCLKEMRHQKRYLKDVY